METDKLGNYELLARHLRNHPFATPENTQDLAKEFGLEPEFVEEVIRALSGPAPRGKGPEDIWLAIKTSVNDAWRKAYDAGSRGFRQATERPLLFVVLTGIALLVLAFLGGMMSSPDERNITYFQIGLIAVIAASSLFIFVSHLLCYGRHGRVRIPIYGAIAAFIVLAVTFSSMLIITGAVAQLGGLAFAMLLALAFSLMVSVGYGALGVAAALVGGLLRIRRANRNEVRQSRQEMILRVFEIERRLRTTRDKPQARLKTDLQIFKKLRRSPYYFPISFVIGIAMGAVEVLTLGSLDNGSGEGTNGMLIAFLGLVTFAITAATLSVIGYCGGRVGRSVLGVLVAWVGSWVPMLLPVGNYGLEYAKDYFSTMGWVFTTALVAFLGMLTGIGAFIEQQTSQDRRRQNDDPALLLAELVKLQWRLNPKTQATCVLVVDVARSTAMKANADPLKIEWSFREYQLLIEGWVNRNNGEVLSTAGDGAVATFATCNEALLCAKQIQTEMPRFNARVNRLDDPFRLRIGLHTGQTSAQMADVQYNELIDIAAHVESHSPVGGIAVTERVASLLPNEAFAALKEEVAGQPVSIVLNPTIGA